MGIEKELSSVRKDVPLVPLTTFKIGGPARYFYLAKSNEELVEAVRAARAARLPFFILGGGSNLLVADDGFDGLAIRIKDEELRIKDKEVSVRAGTLLGEVVATSIEVVLTGLEWAVGIPGTVGGAIRGNVGAYGHCISELVLEVRVLDEEGRVRALSNGSCGFGYRESLFEKKPWVILEATFGLGKGTREESRRLIGRYLDDRRRRIPYFPSAGCVFENPEVRGLELEVRRRIPEERIKGGMVPAWTLIEQCGLKGEQIGGARISDKHANFIVNLGGAKADDVVALIKLCKEQVQEKFGVVLEEEICYVGEF